MLYRLSAMEGTSFRQISDQTGREQVRTQLIDLMAINVTLTALGTVSHVQLPKIVSHMDIKFNMLAK